jgi:hypothetical protein
VAQLLRGAVYDYNNMTSSEVEPLRHHGEGINSVVQDIIELSRNHTIVSLKELFQLSVS